MNSLGRSREVRFSFRGVVEFLACFCYLGKKNFIFLMFYVFWYCFFSGGGFLVESRIRGWLGLGINYLG